MIDFTTLWDNGYTFDAFVAASSEHRGLWEGIHRLARIPEWGNRVLRVIVNGKSVPPRIVTAFFDRRRIIP